MALCLSRSAATRENVVRTLFVLALLLLPGITVGVVVHESQAHFVADFLSAVGRTVPSPLVCSNFFTCTTEGYVNSIHVLYVTMSTIPETISQASGTLTTLFMRNLQVGPQFGVPRSFTAMSSLRDFRVMAASNTGGLKGTIPSEISTLTGLTYLNLGYNSLTGSIPRWMSRLTNLQTLGLSRNALGGKIPAFFCTTTGFQFLELNNNAFHGAIPTCIQNGTRRGSQLSDNFLTYDSKPQCTAAGLNRNCLSRDLCKSSTQKTPQQCSQFCGMATSPADAFFSRECRVVDASRLWGSGSWDISKVVFQRIMRRTCNPSAGPCGAANCKAQGGWCRQEKTQCCCMPGKEPLIDDSGRIVGCTSRMQNAEADREENTFVI